MGNTGKHKCWIFLNYCFINTFALWFYYYEDDFSNVQAEADKEASVEGVISIPQVADDNKEAVVDATVKNVTWQMEKDLKTKALKQLQSHMWREAYKTGLLQGE